MLYNRSAVKDWKAPTRELRNRARRLPFFRESKFLREYVLDTVDIGRTRLETFLDCTEKLKQNLKHDYKHKDCDGIRTAARVFSDKKGHCIEQNILLYTALRILGIKTRFTVIKNPIGYAYGFEELAFHLMLRFSDNGIDYLADQVEGGVVEDNSNFRYAARQDMTFQEFMSFILLDAGEDMMQKGKTKEALDYFSKSLLLDPNNYPVYFSAAESYLMQEKFWKARECCRAGIRIAPDIADVYKEYGDFLRRAEEPKDKVLRQYKKAAARPTQDSFLLHQLSKRLIVLGEERLANQVALRVFNLTNGEDLDNWHKEKGDWIRKKDYAVVDVD